jgi:excisionase family DNA binding protein
VPRPRRLHPTPARHPSRQMTTAPEYLRARDIARLTGVSLRTARRWISEEILASGKIGGARLVAKSELERLLPPRFSPADSKLEMQMINRKINSLSIFGKRYYQNTSHVFCAASCDPI